MTSNNFVPRLIALDMDGTLLDSNKEVPVKNKEAIKMATNKGVEVILSTGRHFSDSEPIAKDLNLKYVITANGSEIWTTSGDLIDRQLIDTEIVSKLVELHKKHKTWIWMSSTKSVFRGEVPEDISAYQWLKFGFDTEDDSVREEILKELALIDTIEVSNSNPNNIEVNALGINKAIAIEKICEREGISIQEVMAVGDSLNDIKMIEAAGLGVAMGNAQPPVKERADWVTGDHNDSGVAQAINYWVK